MNGSWSWRTLSFFDIKYSLEVFLTTENAEVTELEAESSMVFHAKKKIKKRKDRKAYLAAREVLETG
jgi:hypothetical protein